MSKGPEFGGDIRVGSEIPLLLKRISRRQLASYAASTRDPYPVHYDRDFARAQGFEDICMDGPMGAAFMAELVIRWTGRQEPLRKLSITYRALVYPGDELSGSGRVMQVHLQDGVRFIECDIRLQNQHGKTVATGKATVVL
ncbi:MAG: MaoC/PaaZ C-terminal domain-containing protein [Chloroflexota bacterium]